jgi:hypothetical protein
MFPAPPLGELVTSVDAADLERLEKAAKHQDAAYTRIDNVSLVASYNWVDVDKPEIVVPGETATVRPRDREHQLI